jgi:hypothetical protein
MVMCLAELLESWATNILLEGTDVLLHIADEEGNMMADNAVAAMDASKGSCRDNGRVVGDLASNACILLVSVE